MRYLRRSARFYLSLLGGAPGHLWAAADVVGRVIFLVGLVIAVSLGIHGDIAPWVAFAFVLAVVVVAVLKENFDRYELLGAERDRWAPNDQLRVTIEGDGHLWEFGLIIRNDDAGATFRLDVVDARTDASDIGSKLPWALPWSSGQRDQHLARNESARLVLATCDAAAASSSAFGHYKRPAYVFPDPKAPQGSVSGLGLRPHDPLRVEVTFRLFRVEPEPAFIERTIAVTFEIVGDATAEWVSAA